MNEPQMDADGRRWDLNELTEKIIGAAFKVLNELGPGFLEKVYENALAYELRKMGLLAEQQEPVIVYYDQQNVGTYFADILVEKRVIVETKTVTSIDDNQMAQCLNYLRATRHKICLWLNFAKPRLEIKRIVHNL